MALSLEQLKAAFKTDETRQSRPNNYYPFWDMKTGEQCVIRFLPDADTSNPHGFLVEKAMHNLTINGENKTIRCLKPDDCPICKVSAAYYKDDDKVNGKKYWRKKQHIAQALIIEDPLPANAESGEKHEGQVRFIALGYQIYNIIKESFESGELDEVPFAFENGCDFIIKKTSQGEYASYAVGTRFARKSSDLTEDQIAVAEDQMIELSTLLPAMPEVKKVEDMLEAAFNGGSYEDGEGSSSTPAEKAKPAAKAEEAASAKEESSDDGEESDADVDDMLAKIRARQGNKA